MVIIVHVGPHKTGTTSLQMSLSKLHQENFKYFGPYGALSDDVRDYCRGAMTAQHLVNAIRKNSDLKSIVISNENFSGPLGKIETSKISAIFEKLKVAFPHSQLVCACAVKEKHRWARSYYNEFYRSGDLQSLKSFYECGSYWDCGIYLGKDGMSKFHPSYTDIQPIADYCEDANIKLQIMDLSDARNSDICEKFREILKKYGVEPIRGSLLNTEVHRPSFNCHRVYRRFVFPVNSSCVAGVRRKYFGRKESRFKKFMVRILNPFGYRLSGYNDTKHFSEETIWKRVIVHLVIFALTKRVK